jgi:hypothetical protein
MHVALSIRSLARPRWALAALARPRRALAALALGGAVLAIAGALAATLAAAARADAPPCADPYPPQRDPANPLMLAQAPGGNPLHGARLFVDGPAHGAAAGAIAGLLGAAGLEAAMRPALTDSVSWQAFAQRVNGALPLLGAAAAYRVRMLEKIAIEPETQKIWAFAAGGGPGAIYGQAEKLFCHNFTADPGSIPVIMTYFLHPMLGGCATPAQIAAARPDFEGRVNELVAAIGDRPVILLLEEDGFGSSSCMARQGDLGDWEALIRYEVDRAATLPHAVVYVEAGYADANSAAYTARALNRVDIGRIRGFFTNDTHFDWTIDEIRWGERVSKLTHGADFVVNTAQNGNGPLVPRDRAADGNEVLCNPPGRAVGPRPTTSTGFSHVDAFLWTAPPGNSSGTCNGGTPSGTFDAARAVALAAAANGHLGPGYPSEPY